MTASSIIYANSLFSLADGEDKLESVLEALEFVKSVLEDNPEYPSVLDAPMIKLEERLSLIDSAFCTVDEYVVNFLKLLCEKKNVHTFADCFKQFVKLYNKKNNIEKITVITAVPLSDSLKPKLMEKLERETGKKVIPEYRTDKSILGGIIIRTENSQTDASVLSRLEAIKAQLIRGDM